ncbi:MAG: hypothetical protein GYB55_23465 [Cytophagales bacterium]|uniref:Uncharacterized protein n=1 Tax=Cyclobacterium amurskyense TaxID=320787 RepID=A0A0H4PEM8_9BACT|nr:MULTISPECIES: hypothetical protein [Cyclobacterium]AKP52931.1 hypothetical protein CA2015_3551 [Cyclobacterium amurskyense]MBI0397119.1 hypothetical protein [Cyclobacterium marinum]MBR9777820.1 hypothetical protein [Cytophagales bacterium]|tara:strand:+ start:13463 stop:13684 length:222 start_codon:yes stop_codon:yes gene_type:complete
MKKKITLQKATVAMGVVAMSVGLFNSFNVEAEGGCCTSWVCCQAGLPNTICYDEEGRPWIGDEKKCNTDSCTV